MKCKTCGDKGMMLMEKKISDREIRMEVVVCDFCGGWSVDGVDCENCQADAEGRARLHVWVSEEDYPQSMEEYRNKLKQAMEEYRRKMEEEEGS